MTPEQVQRFRLSRKVRCVHRGEKLQASCNCKAVFWCNSLKTTCGQIRPTDDYVTVTLPDGTRTETGVVGWQSCGECEHFTTAKHQQQPANQ